MASNTSKGRGQKGSKFWMQTLANLDSGNALQKEMNRVDPAIGHIIWLSPLKAGDYGELKTNNIPALQNVDMSFWPSNGPWWDGVGMSEDGCILLVEAKGHSSETKTHCTATSPVSIETIKNTMREVHSMLAAQMQTSQVYDEDVWYGKYYQMGNRLSFLTKLREQGCNAKLVLLNLVADPTNIPTTEEEWQDHYQQVFREMVGTEKLPDHVVMVNVDVG